MTCLAGPILISRTNVATAGHAVQTVVVDAEGALVNNASTDEYYVCMGDSLTLGSHDDIDSDNASSDGRNIGKGFTPILTDALTSAKGHRVLVVNEGVSGAKSIDGVARISTLLRKHPQAQCFLILYGTNDAWSGTVPSGRGLRPGDAGYAGSYKANMQRIVNAIRRAGKSVVLAKIPAFCPFNGNIDLMVQDYNRVIDELVADDTNGITIAPPDFYAYFATHYTLEYADSVHPNGLGYQSMAKIWRDRLAP